MQPLEIDQPVAQRQPDQELVDLFIGIAPGDLEAHHLHVRRPATVQPQAVAAGELDVERAQLPRPFSQLPNHLLLLRGSAEGHAAKEPVELGLQLQQLLLHLVDPLENGIRCLGRTERRNEDRGRQADEDGTAEVVSHKGSRSEISTGQTWKRLSGPGAPGDLPPE